VTQIPRGRRRYTWVSITLIVLVQLNYVLAPRIPILHRF